MASPHVALKSVTKHFPGSAGGQAVHALGPIDLSIRQGEFFAVVGPSGCGKSTLLELIAGLLPATEGQIEFEGRAIGNEVPDGIGVVFQEDACFPWLSVHENVEFGLRKAAIAPDEKARRVRDAIAMMGLGEFSKSYPTQLSGGMRQRVCIARTLVAKPRLLLLARPAHTPGLVEFGDHGRHQGLPPVGDEAAVAPLEPDFGRRPVRLEPQRAQTYRRH
jgi:NitT/TauT family transport system ATP-binding protein